MSHSPTDWHDVTIEKLTTVLGPTEGPALARAVLTEAGLQRVASADELRAIASMLDRRGGIEAAIGGLLMVHATLYGHISR